MQDYKDSLNKKIKELITQGFPEKIVQLNELLSTPMFYKRKFSDIYPDLNIPAPKIFLVNNNEGGDSAKQPAKRARTVPLLVSGSKIMYLSTGSVPCNSSLCEMVQIVKPIIHKVIEDSNFLKMWISSMNPKFEDRNNFGVSIQKANLDEIQNVKTCGESLFSRSSNYFLSHAKIDVLSSN
uniref:Proteasome activator PA28 N-terminal domain-containing protein n=1 Tax=Glossina brevipalpis TaxID=37001 RepID=A0A1A9WYY6_9MUSC